MNIHHRLLHLFPDFKQGDWLVGEVGGVQTIERWNRPEPKPDISDLAGVTPGQEDKAAREKKFDGYFDVNNLSEKDKVILLWIASRTGGGELPRIFSELKAVWRSL